MNTETAEWEETVKTRADELTALAESVKVLNDDDALKLFKKTLPSAASFIQVGETAATMQKCARESQNKGAKKDFRLDFIGLALRGKQMGFARVIKMIDDMVAVLKKEQEDDNHKKEHWAMQLDLSDDKRKQWPMRSQMQRLQ